MAYMLGRQQIFLDLDDEEGDFDDVTEIMSNAHLNTNFLTLAREVIILFRFYLLFPDPYQVLSLLHI